MQVLRRLQELREQQTEKLREELLEVTGLVGEDDQVRLEIEPHGESYFAVLLSCKSCGYKVHVCSLILDDKHAWAHKIASASENAIARFSEHECKAVLRLGRR